MPGGLESVWTYVDPSTMQGVTAGVVAAVLAGLVLFGLTNATRVGLSADLEEPLARLARDHEFRRRTSFLRSGVRIEMVHDDTTVSLRFGYKRGRIRGRLRCRRGGGLFRAAVYLDDVGDGLAEWLRGELERAARAS